MLCFISLACCVTYVLALTLIVRVRPFVLTGSRASAPFLFSVGEVDHIVQGLAQRIGEIHVRFH